MHKYGVQTFFNMQIENIYTLIRYQSDIKLIYIHLLLLCCIFFPGNQFAHTNFILLRREYRERFLSLHRIDVRGLAYRFFGFFSYRSSSDCRSPQEASAVSSSSELSFTWSCPVVFVIICISWLQSYFRGWFSQNLSSLDSNCLMVGAETTFDGRLFQILTVLCVNEYFLKSSLERVLYKITPCCSLFI